MRKGASSTRQHHRPVAPLGNCGGNQKVPKSTKNGGFPILTLFLAVLGCGKKHHSLNIMPLKKSMQLTQVGIPPFFSVSSIFFRYLKVFMSGAWMKLFWGEVFEKMPVVGGFHPPKNGSILPGARKNM